MKSNRDFQTSGGEEAFRKSPKLDPVRKSGKERHTMYKSLDQDEDEDREYLSLRKRESVYDYMDDGDGDDSNREDER